MSVSTMAHGVRLTLSAPGKVYVRDALIRVTVSVENVSTHNLTVFGGSGPLCGSAKPGVRVITPTGVEVFPPAIPPMFASCGPPLRGATLRPGGLLTARPLAILRADRLQADVWITRGSTEVTTPPLAVRLTPGIAPHVTITTTPFLQAAVRPSTPQMRGRLYFLYGYRCPTAGPLEHPTEFSASGTLHWEVMDHPSHGAYWFQCGCAHPVAWHVVAGWLNQPVATIDQTSP